MKVVERTITQKVYIASDGTEFTRESDCFFHEDELVQREKERVFTDRTGIKTHADFPSLLNPRYDRAHMLFLIKDEADLDEFIDVYDYWFTDLYRYPEVDKATFTYPDVLYILDFPSGYDEHRLYRISQLFNQFSAFNAEIISAISK